MEASRVSYLNEWKRRRPSAEDQLEDDGVPIATAAQARYVTTTIRGEKLIRILWLLILTVPKTQAFTIPNLPRKEHLQPLAIAAQSSPLSGLGTDGLSKYHQSILSRMATDRQRFVSGKYPVVCQVTEPPTLKWLGRGNKALATSQLMINGTAVERSLASYDRFQWLDDEEREELHEKHALLSWELLAVISINKPGYVSILPGYGAGSTAASLRFLESTSQWDRWKRNGLVLDELEQRVCRDRLWVTGFSLTGRAGLLSSVDTDTGHIQSVNSRTSKSLLWPNEVSPMPSQFFFPPADDNHQATTKRRTIPLQDLRDAVLVSDGFLVPGKDRGGIYVVNQPGNPNTEWTVCLTDQEKEDHWFYHR